MTEPARRLLVVDDDHDIVKLVTVSMTRRGYHVDGVTTLDDAMRSITQSQYDVVLTDKNLKGATGLELIDALTLVAPRTAIVLMTAYPDGAVGRIASLDGYLSKPFRSLDAVAQALGDAVDRHQRSLERQRLTAQLGEVKTALVHETAPSRR